jgi:eukaryotic-like serine/threonine-protein kinase
MITHDRWQRIKDIFYAAQDRIPAERSAFLAEVCGDDASIREEVDALLAADAGNEDFLSSPAYEFAAGMLASEASEFSTGQRVGRFEILHSLGAGGMGQIYLAFDAQLGRKIALKLISQEFASDTRRVLRFEQEARAASALNHPNVCVIHDIGITDQGRHFIAMEYIQGVTLRDQLVRGPFKPLEALQVIIQVGAALASAHAIGIVHRDVKPENIMLRPDGYVKVVDFGLAKLTELLPEQRRLDDVETNVRTEPRTLMGTVKYMSPEQLRETEVDERTDIWSLGIVLYEMLTCTTPFDARSPNDSIALVLGPQAAELKFPDEIPIQFQQIVTKALEKDRARRYQNIAEFMADVKILRRELERNANGAFTSLPAIELPSQYTPDVSVQPTRKTKPDSTIFTRLKSQMMLTADSLLTEIRTHKATALFAGVMSVFALLLFLPTAARLIDGLARPGVVTQITGTTDTPKMKPLTNTGTSVCAAISPDGKFVARAEEQNGKQQLLLTNTTNAGSSVVAPPMDVQYVGLTFSQDSNDLYFTRRDNDKKGVSILYRVPIPDNSPIQIKKDVDSPISFSPNGDRFAFVRYDKPSTEFSLIVSSVDGSNEQVIARRKDGDTLSLFGPAWSPDGATVLCPTGHWENGFHMTLVGFDLTNGSEHPIGNQSWFSILQVAWESDMSSMIISAREHETSPHKLWRIKASDGTARQITFDLAEYRGVSLAGDNIVTVRMNLNWKIWIATPLESQKAAPIASGVGFNYGLSWTSNDKIVYSSMAPDRLNLSRIDTDGTHQVQLTTNAGDNYTPASSADGRFIVFTSNRTGSFNIWRINADGSDPKQLTFSDANFYPSCSPDNQWVAYDNLVKSKSSVWKVPLEGGEPIKVGERYRMPIFSPDNQTIACRYDLVSGSDDGAIFSAQGGRPLQHFPIPNQDWQQLRWLAPRRLSYVVNNDGYSNIWSYDLDTGATQQLTNFNSDQIYAYAWSPDYKRIACQRGTRSSDVTIISER